MLVETPPKTIPAIAPAPSAARTRSKQDVPVLGRAGQNFRRNWVTTSFMIALSMPTAEASTTETT